MTALELYPGVDWYGHREEDLRVELLDLDNNVLDPNFGTVEHVRLVGSVFDRIARGGSAQITMVESNTDWLDRRLRILYRVNGEWVPRGIYLPATPTGPRGGLGEARSVELYDLNLVLDEDLYLDNQQVLAGEDVLARAVAEAAAGGVNIVVDGTATALTDARFDRAISRLEFINELLGIAAYDPLRMDDHGVPRSQRSVDPWRRAHSFEFDDGEYTGLYLDGWEDEEDLFKVPNRWICTSQSDGENEPLVSVAENLNGNDHWPYRFSHERRQRWVTRLTENVEVASQEALDIVCRGNLSQASNKRRIISFQCAWVPIALNDTIRFRNREHGISSMFRVTQLEEDFTLPGASMMVRAWEVGEL